MVFQGLRHWPTSVHTDSIAPDVQEARIESFRQLLAAENAWVHERHDYTTLLRFLRASNYDATSARQQWVDSLHWRRVHHADSILTRFKFPERAAFLEAFPQGYHKTDRMGRPVFVQQIGRADFDKIFQITNDARLMQHHIAENERLLGVIFPAASAAVGADVHQTFVLLDLAGVRFANFMRLKKMMSMFLKMDQDNYPETLGRLVVVNAPDWFGSVFKFVKQFMAPGTQSKMEVLHKDQARTRLLHYIAPENLLEAYGGCSVGRLQEDIGPWQVLEPKPGAVIPASVPASRAASTRLSRLSPGFRASSLRPRTSVNDVTAVLDRLVQTVNESPATSEATADGSAASSSGAASVAGGSPASVTATCGASTDALASRLASHGMSSTSGAALAHVGSGRLPSGSSPAVAGAVRRAPSSRAPSLPLQRGASGRAPARQGPASPFAASPQLESANPLFGSRTPLSARKARVAGGGAASYLKYYADNPLYGGTPPPAAGDAAAAALQSVHSGEASGAFGFERTAAFSLESPLGSFYSCRSVTSSAAAFSPATSWTPCSDERAAEVVAVEAARQLAPQFANAKLEATAADAACAVDSVSSPRAAAKAADDADAAGGDRICGCFGRRRTPTKSAAAL